MWMKLQFSIKLKSLAAHQKDVAHLLSNTDTDIG